MTNVEAGLRFGARDLGLDGRPLRLVAGLVAVLRDATLVDGWLGGGLFPASCVDAELWALEKTMDVGLIDDSRAWLVSLRSSRRTNK